MFHKASVRLAGFYLAIMMLISLFFSISIYELSVHELDKGLRRPDFIIQGIQGEAGVSFGGTSFSTTQPLRQQIMTRQEESYQQAKNRVLDRLIITNILILVGGGFLCYFLALRTLKPVEEAHQALERFTADASHELRTPIAAMQTEIEVALLNPKLTTNQAKAILESNLEELTKLTALSEGLLRLAQLGSSELEREQTAVTDFVLAAVDRVKTPAKHRDITINVSEQVDAVVPGNAASLTEAVVVILDNAIKYSPEKSTVEVRAKQDAKQVSLEIQDHGMGMKASEVAHIFDRFYRADTARSKTKAGGYGIGLAIAKNIIELHGGTISVTSKPKKGSTFIISLPKVFSV